MSKIMKFRPIKPNLLLKEGDEIGSLKVIHICGKPQKKNFIELFKCICSQAAKEAWKSVRKIAGSEFNILLPGRGAPVIYSASQKVRRLLEGQF
jgi:hypothetical protein